MPRGASWERERCKGEIKKNEKVQEWEGWKRLDGWLLRNNMVEAGGRDGKYTVRMKHSTRCGVMNGECRRQRDG